jgi:hypothetical protein
MNSIIKNIIAIVAIFFGSRVDTCNCRNNYGENAAGDITCLRDVITCDTREYSILHCDILHYQMGYRLR